MSIGAILSALAAIPKILGYVETFARAVTMWYVARAEAETHSMIANAAAKAARAKTQEERLKAAEAWRKALSRPRISE